MKPMWIMIAGPYKSGAASVADGQANLDFMNKAAYEVMKKGHLPIIGVNAVLPIIHAVGENHFDEIMMPLCLRLTERCDAILRIGGASTGADQEVEKFIDRGLPVFRSVADIPNVRY